MSKQKQTLYPRFSESPPFSVDAPGYQPVKGETIPRRNPAYKDKLITTPSEDVTTIFDIIKRGADKFGNAKALGTRRIIKIHHETKKIKKVVDGQTKEMDKVWTYYELSGYTYISFVEYERLVLQVGAGLRKIGMVKDDRLHIFAATRYSFPTPYLQHCSWWLSSRPKPTVLTGWLCLMEQPHSPCLSPLPMIHWAKKGSSIP